LVHGINSREIDDCEEEYTGSVCHRSEQLSSLIDLDLGDLRLLLLKLNVFGGCSGIVKDMDELIVLEDISDVFILGQTRENIIFNPLEFLGRFCVLLNNAVFLLLEFRHLLSDELIKHLLLKTERRDGKVENCNLHRGLWRVVRIGQGSRH